jgi:hypothetical protein
MLAVDPVLWDATLLPNNSKTAIKEGLPPILANSTKSGMT